MMAEEKTLTSPLMKLVQSMDYKVVIMPSAKRRLDMYVQYTLKVLRNRQAAKAILADAKATLISENSIWMADKRCLFRYKMPRSHLALGTSTILPFILKLTTL